MVYSGVHPQPQRMMSNFTHILAVLALAITAVTVSTIDVPNGLIEKPCAADRDARCGNLCGAKQVPDFISVDEVARMKRLVEWALGPIADAPAGPALLDFNSGFVLPAGAARPGNLYANPVPEWVQADLQMVQRIVYRVAAELSETFNTSLYTSAPNFLARIKGDPAWEPSTLHDEYFHAHVDKNNTGHYDYSGLIYLSTVDEDFTGGLFEWLDDAGNVQSTVAPRAGMLSMFTSSQENPHRLQRVETGERIALSLWFTCNPTREMPAYYDGKPHRGFLHGQSSAGTKKAKPQARKRRRGQPREDQPRPQSSQSIVQDAEL